MNKFENIPSKDSEDSVDFKRYISLIISNWYWFVAGLFISISIAYGINRWSEKVFTVSSTLLIKDDQNQDLTEIFPGSQGYRSQSLVKNEVGILKSFNLNYRVIKQLPEFQVVYTSIGRRGIAETRLYKNAPFIVLFDTLSPQKQDLKVNIEILSEKKYRLTLKNNLNVNREMSFGDRFKEEGFDFTIVLRDSCYKHNISKSNKFYFYFIDPDILANHYRSKLTITPIEEDASLVFLSTNGFVPEQEADYLNTLMQVYLEFGLEYKNKTAENTITFIDKQLHTISDSLKHVETELQNFRLANKLINISQEGSIIQGKLEQLDAERSKLTMQKNYYAYLNEYIESKKDNTDVISPSTMGITDELLIKLVDELSAFQKQQKDLSLNFYKSSEPFKNMESKISVTRAAIKENVNNGIENLNKSIQENDNKLKSIEKEIQKLPSTERQMITIQRKFDINNTVYTFLLEKRAEAGIARASNVPDNRIIDKAGIFSSAVIKPQRKQNLLIAFFLGITIPFVVIVMIDYLNNKIIDKYDIEKRTSVPILGYINHNKLNYELPVVRNPGSTLSESFRSVRTNLKYFLHDLNSPVISISSTIIGEGKTFVSMNIAAILAMSGKKVLLVGLDLRKPRIHKIFGIFNDKGISNYLIGDINFDEVIVNTEIENLSYAPSGPVPPNPAELIESDKMLEFIKICKSKFDFIVIDTPPVAVVTDAFLISKISDFYLFVVRQRYSAKNTIDLIEEVRSNKNMKGLGIIINDISISGYYGYGLRYGYGLGYGYNYGYNYYNQYSKYGYSDSAKSYYIED